MNCYFCNNLLIKLANSKFNFYEPCDFCRKDDILNVYTVVDNDHKLLYVQIYVGIDYEIITLPRVGFFAGTIGTTVECGRKYQIRLHLQENLTVISEVTNNNMKELLKIPGFPINPANAKEKLKLYLTFS